MEVTEFGASPRPLLLHFLVVRHSLSKLFLSPRDLFHLRTDAEPRSRG